MKDNDKIKIDEALSHIKKAIIEKGETKSENSKKDDFILLDKIISKKDKKFFNKGNINKEKDNKKVDVLKKKPSTVTKRVKNKKNSTLKRKVISTKLTRLSKEKSPVDDLVEKEVKPIIKKWIDKNLRIFVKNIVVEEMKSISKATQKPTNR